MLKTCIPCCDHFMSILRSCKESKKLENVLYAYSHLCGNGVEAQTDFGRIVVSVLVDLESMLHAQQVFDRMEHLDQYTCNALITGYVRCQNPSHAISLYETFMEFESQKLGRYSFIALTKACATLRDPEKGYALHVDAARNGLLVNDVFVCGALIDMYAKCGWVSIAQELLDKLPVQDVVMWTALIAGFSQHGESQKALDSMAQMQSKGIAPNAYTYVCILKSFDSLGEIQKVYETHNEIIKKGLESELFVGNSLINVYFKYGLIVTGQSVFDRLPIQDVVSWTELVTRYAEIGCSMEALHCYEWMQHVGVFPNAVTYLCLLKACGMIGVTFQVQQLHSAIIKRGFEFNNVTGNTLVHMYAKCGLLETSQVIFTKLCTRDVVTWNALMTGYLECGCWEEILLCLKEMKVERIPIDHISVICFLKACVHARDRGHGLVVHMDIIKKGLENNYLISDALVDMYANFGYLDAAIEVFGKLPVHTVDTWNALITGYAENGYYEEILQCLSCMQNESTALDNVSFACALKACGLTGASIQGQNLHCQVTKEGLETESLVAKSLITMYAKCGLLTEAQLVFDRVCTNDVVTWTSLMSGYSQLGDNEMVVRILLRMLSEGVEPNAVTFITVLNACSDIGLLNMGHILFESIFNENSVPVVDHYTCLIDLLSRSGHLEKAEEFINKMPISPDIVVWHTLLGACWKWGDVVIARHAFEYTVELDKKDESAYICMYNVYVDAGMTDKAIRY